jgi:hypothetical protein
VIADADANGVGTAQSLTRRLSQITGQAVTVGAWTAGPPRVGFFVVPSAAARGCIDGYLGCMSAAGHQAHSPDKGRLGALLAVHNDEDPRLGPGARARVFDFERPELAPLVSFLRAF